MEFNDLHDSENIYLYAGDLPEGNRENVPFIGLTLKPEAEWWNEFHINHDVTAMIDLPDNSVDIFQSEDVFEHIEYDQLKSTINEIYRVLKPGGRFMCLEFSKINNELLSFIYKNYSKAIPTLGKYIVGSSKPYEYLINSIDAFYNQEQLLELIINNGFANVEYRNLSNGISAIHSGWKI